MIFLLTNVPLFFNPTVTVSHRKLKAFYANIAEFFVAFSPLTNINGKIHDLRQTTICTDIFLDKTLQAFQLLCRKQKQMF